MHHTLLAGVRFGGAPPAECVMNVRVALCHGYDVDASCPQTPALLHLYLYAATNQQPRTRSTNRTRRSDEFGDGRMPVTGFLGSVCNAYVLRVFGGFTPLCAVRACWF